MAHGKYKLILTTGIDFFGSPDSYRLVNCEFGSPAFSIISFRSLGYSILITGW